MKKMTCMIVGLGSIGGRHARLLGEMGHRVICVTRRRDLPYPSHDSIKAAILAENPDIAVICTSTSDHITDCRMLEVTKFSGLLLIEKPLFAHLPVTLPRFSSRTYIGYNLRCHPVVQQIRELIAGKRIFSAQFTVGQYLPDWRPGTDYRTCYSAAISGGGGALRDLSHELDLATWLLGPWVRLAVISGKWGNMEIETEDTVDILASLKFCPSVSIHLDYHNRFPRRLISIQADGVSMEGNLITNTLRVNDSLREFSLERDHTYKSQWHDILSGQPQFACSLQEGIAVMGFIEAVERASQKGSWESNG